MRVSLLTTSFPRTPGDASGHFVETEARRLARAGHEVHVVAAGLAAGRVDRREAGALTVWGAGGGSLFGPPGAVHRALENPLCLFALVRFMPRVRGLLARIGPTDRTIAHFLVPCGYPLALGVRGELEVVLHGSDVRAVLAFPSPLRRRVVGALLDRGASFRFVSHDLRDELRASLSARERERLARASRVELPPIDVPRPTARKEEGGRPHWVVCGRLVGSKRVDRAIREAARRKVDLTVIGDGPLRSELEALASAFEPRARFVGHVPRERALSLIASAHKLLHLSDAEGAPTVVREARALGVPVLATPVGDVARWALVDPGIEIFRPA